MQINMRFHLLLITTSVALVCGVCNMNLGERQFGDYEIEVLHAKKGPVQVAEHMALIFDYKVDSTDNVEMTYVKFLASPMKGGCNFEWPANFNLKKKFKVIISSQAPVKQFNATATIYGIRRTS